MWTAEQRTKHKVAQRKERRGYPTDISDKEWKLVEPLLRVQRVPGAHAKRNFAMSSMRCVTWSVLAASGACCQTISLLTRRCITGFAA